MQAPWAPSSNAGRQAPWREVPTVKVTASSRRPTPGKARRRRRLSTRLVVSRHLDVPRAVRRCHARHDAGRARCRAARTRWAERQAAAQRRVEAVDSSLRFFSCSCECRGREWRHTRPLERAGRDWRKTGGMAGRLVVRGRSTDVRVPPRSTSTNAALTARRALAVNDEIAPTVAAELLTLDEAAALLRTPVATLRYWRHLGVGPDGFRLGRRVVYRRQDVDRWVAEQQHAQSSRR